MKKRIFALALALCMMLSVMPTSFANGVLTLGDGTDTGVLTLDNGTSGRSTTTSGSVQPRQDGVLYNTSDIELLDTATGETGEEPVVDNSGALDDGENVKSGEVFTTLTNDNDPPSGGAGLNTSPTNGLELKKTVSDAGDKITLEAWVTGQTVTVTQTTTKPMDIILVLDTSSEMIEGNDKTTRLNALKTAAKTFINNVAKQTVAQGEQPTRIAIVKYNDEAFVESGTELPEEDALVFVNASGATALNGIVDTLTVKDSGAANCNLGLAHAKNIFQSANNGQYKDRDRVVILLSAGVFGSSGKLNTTNDYIAAMDTIWLSSILKLPKQYNVINDANTPVRTGKHSQKVYEITPSGSPYTYGIDFNSRYYSDTPGAAHTEAEFTTLYCSGTNNSGYNGCGAIVYCVGLNMPTYRNSGDTAARINEVMYRVCSHRPDGTHVENGTNYNSWETAESVSGWFGWVQRYTDERTRNHENGYFLTADNADKLNDIFKSISSNVTTGGSSNESLTTETVVKDVISPYFQIPAGGTVTAYSVAYAGNDTWGGKIADYTPTISADNTTVTVDGFNFSDNWVGINTATGKVHGQKLVIEIAIEPKTGFLGGQDIPTNDNTQAGVYLNDTLVENFPTTDAKTDIAIPDVTVGVEDKNVYLSNEMSDAEMLADAVVKIGDVELDLKKENFGLEEWQYAFLSEIKVVANEGDSIFETTCTVKDKAGNEKSNKDSAGINVFKPVLTFKDSTIYLGQTPNYSEENYGNPLVAWKNGTTDAQNVTMSGNRPSVDVEFTDPDDFTVCRDIRVKSVQLNGEGEYVDDTTVKNGTKDYFTVHVVKPVVEFQDSTIYLGHEPTEAELEAYNIVKDGGNHKITWTHTKNDGTYTEDYDYPAVTFDFDSAEDNEDYSDCALISATVYSGGLESHDGSFTVHVLKPSFSVQDGYIYQGQTKDLTECITLSDNWTDKSSCTKNENIVGDKPDKDAFVFAVGNEDVDAFAAMECTDLTVTGASIEGKPAIDYFTSEDFTVHVLKPHFTVTTTDLWADYGTNVDLYMGGENYSAIDAVTGVSHTWVYTGDCTGDNVHPAELPDGAPEITLKDVIFAEGATHTMGAVEGKVTISGLEYTNEEIVNEETDQLIEQTASLDDVAVSYVDDKGYVALFVNKFDLTINKSWNGADIYKQDAIFNLYHVVTDAETGESVEDLVTQVVLPAGQPSIEITGLLCGQTYTVSEDDAWTWRWNSDGVKTVEATAHTVSASDPHGEDGHIETVSFINKLINRLWLSFCTFVQNIFGQAAIQKGGN